MYVYIYIYIYTHIPAVLRDRGHERDRTPDFDRQGLVRLDLLVLDRNLYVSTNQYLQYLIKLRCTVF